MKSNVYLNFPNHKNLKKCNFAKKVPLLIGSPTPINRYGYLLIGSFRNPCIVKSPIRDKTTQISDQDQNFEEGQIL